jgi:hypothetical protein
VLKIMPVQKQTRAGWWFTEIVGQRQIHSVRHPRRPARRFRFHQQGKNRIVDMFLQKTKKKQKKNPHEVGAFLKQNWFVSTLDGTSKF